MHAPSPSRLALAPRSAAGPTRMLTPPIASTSPATRGQVSRSAVNTWASITAKSGVVAFSIAAIPLDTCVSAQANRLNGITLFSMPSTARLPHGACRVSDCPREARTRFRAMAAKAVRPSTRVKGGRVAPRIL